MDKCIVCQTNEINSKISPNFCSRICQHIWLTYDLEFSSSEVIKRIALNRLDQLNKLNELEK